MKELIEIHKHIESDAPATLEIEYGLQITRNDREGIASLPDKIASSLSALLVKLDEIIPNDFDYHILLDKEGAFFDLSYADGAMTFASIREDFDESESLIESLPLVPWDEHRECSILNMQLFKQLTDDAATREEDIPTTKELQKAFRDDAKDFIKRTRKEVSKTHILLLSEMHDPEEEGIPYEEESFDTFEQFVRVLPDLMTVRRHVITVVTNGKPLPIDRIDRLKRDAIEELKDMPISYAKATGRFNR